MSIPSQDARLGDRRDAYEAFVSTPAAGVAKLAGNDRRKRALVIETLRAAAQFDGDDWANVRTWLDDQPESN
ncbi:MAG: hypothetical protein AAFX81_18905 [Pseudomonadota bacterium]